MRPDEFYYLISLLMLITDSRSSSRHISPTVLDQRTSRRSSKTATQPSVKTLSSSPQKKRRTGKPSLSSSRSTVVHMPNARLQSTRKSRLSSLERPRRKTRTRMRSRGLLFALFDCMLCAMYQQARPGYLCLCPHDHTHCNADKNKLTRPVCRSQCLLYGFLHPV